MDGRAQCVFHLQHPGSEYDPSRRRSKAALLRKKRIFLFTLIKFKQEFWWANGWPAGAENYFVRLNALAGFDESGFF
jgi:hypothetical protein